MKSWLVKFVKSNNNNRFKIDPEKVWQLIGVGVWGWCLGLVSGVGVWGWCLGLVSGVGVWGWCLGLVSGVGVWGWRKKNRTTKKIYLRLICERVWQLFGV